MGWDPEPVEAAADTEYTAVYEAIRYTITWRDDEGNLLETTQVNYGEIPEYEAPEKEGYEFVGWDPEPVEATADAEYTAVFEAIQYNITLTQFNGNDALESDVETATIGETVTITAPGYDIVSITVTNDTDGSTVEVTGVNNGAAYTFEMPAADVTVEASLEAQTFNIYAENPTGFDTIVDAVIDNDPIREASTDDEVTVRVSWDNEVSVLDSVTVSWGDDETLILTEPGAVNDDDNGRTTYYYSFTMPAADVTITANVSALYNIEIDEMMLSNAMVSVNGSEPGSELYFKAKAGSEVTLDIIPDGGGVVATGVKPTVIVYNDDNGTEIEVSGDNGSYSFTMPTGLDPTIGYVSVSMDAYAVMVTGSTVEEDINYSITVSANGTNLTITDEEILLVSPGTQVEVRAVTTNSFIHDAYAEGDMAVELAPTINEGIDDDHPTDITYSFEMPEAAVDITITFGGA